MARERLRDAVANGDYAGLLDPALWRLLDAAAETTGFGREIGALRFAMARLLAEEEDPRHLATHLARVTTMIVRVTQAQPRMAAADDPVRAALLAELGNFPSHDRWAGRALVGGDSPVSGKRPDDEEMDEETEADGEDEGW